MLIRLHNSVSKQWPWLKPKSESYMCFTSNNSFRTLKNGKKMIDSTQTFFKLPLANSWCPMFESVENFGCLTVLNLKFYVVNFSKFAVGFVWSRDFLITSVSSNKRAIPVLRENLKFSKIGKNGTFVVQCKSDDIILFEKIFSHLNWASLFLEIRKL